MVDKGLGVASALEALREELSNAKLAGDEHPLKFTLQPISLKLQVEVTTEASGKIGWKVLGFGGRHESATTHTLELNLVPFWQKIDGTRTPDFTISSPDVVGDVGPTHPTASGSA